MSKFSIEVDQDIQEAKSSSSLVPRGAYHVAVKEITEEKANNGNEFIKLKLEIIEGEYKGNHLFDSIFFKGSDAEKQKKLLSRIVRIANRFGFKNENGRINIGDEWIGSKCWVKVDIEEKENGRFNRIGFADYYNDQEIIPIIKMMDEDLEKVPF